MRNTARVDGRAAALARNLVHIGYDSDRPAAVAPRLSRCSESAKCRRYRPSRNRPGPTNAYWQGFINNVLNPKGALFYLGVFSQLITPDMSLAQTTVLVAVMVSVSAVFWILFVQTLHLPVIRSGLGRSKVTLDRVFGGVLILFGARVATLK